MSWKVMEFEELKRVQTLYYDQLDGVLPMSP